MAGYRGRVALITGASSGIGRAAALAFAERGAQLVLADVNAEGGEDTARQVVGAGGHALFIEADVSKATDVAALLEATGRAFGRLDFAFNNAGIEGEMVSTVDSSEENWNRVIDVNLKSVWLCMKHELPYLLERRAGAIVNCASIAGLVGFSNASAYAASKHGILGLTKSAALEVAAVGVRINAVCPGVIRTPMVDRAIRKRPELAQDLVAGEPMGRLGAPDEVARAVLWLCSDEAAFVTGVALPVDGGWVAQ